MMRVPDSTTASYCDAVVEETYSPFLRWTPCQNGTSQQGGQINGQLPGPLVRFPQGFWPVASEVLGQLQAHTPTNTPYHTHTTTCQMLVLPSSAGTQFHKASGPKGPARLSSNDCPVPHSFQADIWVAPPGSSSSLMQVCGPHHPAHLLCQPMATIFTKKLTPPGGQGEEVLSPFSQCPLVSEEHFSLLPQISPVIHLLLFGNSSSGLTWIATEPLSTQYQRCFFSNGSLNSFSIPGYVSVPILQPNKDWNLFSVVA